MWAANPTEKIWCVIYNAVKCSKIFIAHCSEILFIVDFSMLIVFPLQYPLLCVYYPFFAAPIIGNEKQIAHHRQY